MDQPNAFRTDAQRARRATEAMAGTLDRFSRFQGGLDRFTCILSVGLLIFVGTVAGCVLLRPGVGG